MTLSVLSTDLVLTGLEAKLIAYTSAMSPSIGSESMHHRSTMLGTDETEDSSSEICTGVSSEFITLGTLMETSYLYLN